MKNEELVQMIRQGHDELLLDLWEQVRRFIRKQAWQYMTRFAQTGTDAEGHKTITGGVSFDDLCQAGFLALRNAVEGYKQEEAAFLTYLDYHLRKAFAEAAGLRTGRRRAYIDAEGNERVVQLPALLDEATSLDAAIPGSDDLTVGDMVADSRDCFEDVTERLFNDQLHDALMEAIDKLPPDEAFEIEQEYFGGMGRREIAEALGVSYQRASQLHNRGLLLIRTSSSRRALEAFLDDRTDFYGGTGFGAFARTQTSPVERQVLRRDRLRDLCIKEIAPEG